VIGQRSFPLALGFVCWVFLPGIASTTVAAQQTRWTAQLRTRIGEVDGPAALTEVFDLEIGTNGEIYVGQPRTWNVLVFSSQGQPLRTIGRRGQGPGEFQTVGRLGWIGDTLWVLNFRNVNLFRPDGSFVRRVAPATLPNLGEGVRMLLPGPILSDGSILLIPESDPAAVARGDVRMEPVVRSTQAGELIDTMAVVSVMGRTVYLNIQRRAAREAHPVADAPLWLNTADGQGLVLVERSVHGRSPAREFRVMRINLAGDTIVSSTFRYQPVAITAEWRNQLFSRLTSRHARSDPPAAVERELREQITLPAVHAPVTQLVPGRDGTIWLRREDAAGTMVDWWVLDAGAALLGMVQLPAGLRVLRADQQTVWGVLKDELDVTRIHVYTLTH
jgi:hypothetical protein